MPDLTARVQRQLVNKDMDSTGLDAIARELCDLLQAQIDAVAGREFNDLTQDELDAYQRRKNRILKLRSELEKFVKPM
jgi:hypothetical protein